MNKPQPHSHCLNCNRKLDKPCEFCPACGQKVRDTPLPIKAFFGDFVQDYFTVDAKFFNSIGLLFFRPGVLTAQFNRGKRKSYIAPFRFYIFTSVVYFTLLTLSGADENLVVNSPTDKKEQLAVIDSLMADSALARNPDSLATAYFALRKEADPDTLEGASEGADMNFLKMRMKRVEENPERFNRALFRSASIGAFFLLPLFAFIMMVLNYRKSRFYVSHLVFSIHFHTFLFASLTFAFLLSKISETLVVSVFVAVAAVYVFIVGRKARLLPSQSGFRGFLKWLLYAGFVASMVFALLLNDSGEVVSVICAVAAYLVLSMINAYKMGVGKALVKSLIVLPVYVLALLMAFIGTTLLGVFTV